MSTHELYECPGEGCTDDHTFRSGKDGTPSWAYDEDHYCVCCGHGSWKYHTYDCELRDSLDAGNFGYVAAGPREALKSDEVVPGVKAEEAVKHPTMLTGDMSFASSHRAPFREGANTKVYIEFDAQDFEDSVGSYLGGPWKVGVISLVVDGGVNEFTAFGRWLIEGEARGYVVMSGV